MAVTYKGNRIILAAQGDAVTGKLCLGSVILDHTAAITCVLKDTAGNTIASLRTTATELSKQFDLECSWVDGIEATTLSAGTVTLILE